MPVIKSNESQAFELPGVTFNTLVSKSRGGSENAVWHVRIAPGTPGQIHRLTRQEVIHILHGAAVATIGDDRHEVLAGDTIVVPPHTDFSLANHTSKPLEAIALLASGGQAIMGTAEPFTPPWAA